MTEEYIKLMNHLEVAGIRTMQEHYDFSRDRLNDYYDSFISYADDHLQKKAAELAFPPTYLYIRKDVTLNAYASSTDEYKILGFHHGAFEQMYDFFEAQSELLNEPQHGAVRKLLEHTENPPFYAFFQYFMMFLYYHEYAHLVQGSRCGSSFFLLEYLGAKQSVVDVLVSHAREFDADILACNAVGRLVAHHFLDEKGQFTATSQELTLLASVALTSIFCYFWIAPGGRVPLYYQEFDHPHPYIRICYIAIYLTNAIAINIPVNIQMDPKLAVTNALKLAEIMISIKFPVAVRRFAEEFKANDQKISDYVNVIINRAVEIPELCNNRPDNVL